MIKLFAVGLTAFVLFVAGCDSPVAPELEKCPQTYEFGNYGCARLVAFLEFPSEPMPNNSLLDLRVRMAQPDGDVLFLDSRPRAGANVITIVRRLPPPPGAGDTLSVWVRAAILENPIPIVAGVPLPVFASDSLYRVVRFTGVGSVPRVDTLYMTLRRP